MDFCQNKFLVKLVQKVFFPVCLISLIESSLFGSSEENKDFCCSRWSFSTSKIHWCQMKQTDHCGQTSPSLWAGSISHHFMIKGSSLAWYWVILIEIPVRASLALKRVRKVRLCVLGYKLASSLSSTHLYIAASHSGARWTQPNWLSLDGAAAC